MSVLLRVSYGLFYLDSNKSCNIKLLGTDPV